MEEMGQGETPRWVSRVSRGLLLEQRLMGCYDLLPRVLKLTFENQLEEDVKLLTRY